MYTINSYYYQNLWLKVFDYTDGKDLFFGTLQNGSYDLNINTPVGHEINVELNTYARAYEDESSIYTSSDFSFTYDTSEVPSCLSPVRIAGGTPVYYSTLQSAYDAAVSGDIIQSQAVAFSEDLFIDLNKSVILDGGYNCDYSLQTGITTLNGIMTISNGTVIIGNFSLE